MIKEQKPGFTDGLRYAFRGLKMGWDKHGGKICTVGGTAGLFLSGMHACRKTYRIHDELAENGRRISEARKQIEGEKKSKRVIRIAKTIGSCSVKTGKHYAADIVGAALSSYAVQKGWHKEHRHYQQAAAMVGVLAADFMNYRNNVISEHGIEADRRYLTRKSEPAISSAGKGMEDGKKNAEAAEEGLHVVGIQESSLRILYSKETTPGVWSESHTLRKLHLEDIRNRLEMDLIYGGSYTVNDVRRYFYGRKGDVAEGALFGRIWDPGDPAHPNRGAKVNLHYEEDEAFMNGEKDWCYILIDIDEEPLFELLKAKKDRDIYDSLGVR